MYIDKYSTPKDKKPFFVNEPWLIDRSLEWIMETGYTAEPLPDEDNIRVYIPLDISKEAILRRLDWIIQKCGAVSFWKNESDFSCDVSMLGSQIEIYDQYWLSHDAHSDGKHSKKTMELVKAFVEKLKDIDEGDGEMFPYDVITENSAEIFQGLFSLSVSVLPILYFRCLTSVTPARITEWNVFCLGLP